MNDLDHPQQCHWAESTPRRCQMLGTMGHGDEHGGTWYCTLHYFEHVGQHRPELQSFEALLPWLMATARDYPDTQWNDDPQHIWERLHGRAATTATYQPARPPAGDGEIPTREELDKILSRLKPGLWARVIRQNLPPHLRTPVPPDPDETEPVHETAEEVEVANARRRAMLAQARERGLIT